MPGPRCPASARSRSKAVDQRGRDAHGDGRRVLAADAGQADRGRDPVDGLGRMALGGEAGPEPRPLRRGADQPDRAQPGAAQGGVAQGGVLGVVVGHDEHVGARRQLGEHDLGEHRHVAVHVDPRPRVGEHREALGGELVGPGVDQVQVEVVAGQDARQLQADVAHPEDRDGGRHGQGFEQDRHLAAAALDAVLAGRLVGEGHANVSGRPPPLRRSRRARETATASRFPPPIEPHAGRRHDHLGARLARARGRGRRRA